jgi:hypothetical protein
MIANVTGALDSPTLLQETRTREIAFARRYLDQKDTLARIAAALGEALDGTVQAKGSVG